MSQTPFHKVMAQTESYIENVKRLIKHKTEGYSVEYKTSYLVKDSPAKRVTYDPGRETRHQRIHQEKECTQGLPSLPTVYSSFRKPPGTNLRELGDESPGA